MLADINITKAQSCSITAIESYDDLQSTVGSLSQSVAGSQRLLDKLSGLGAHCPTCEQSVDSAFIRELINDEASKITEAETKQDEIKRRILEIKRNYSSYTFYNNFFIILNSIIRLFLCINIMINLSK
mgnify:CR=1 FL=1